MIMIKLQIHVWVKMWFLFCFKYICTYFGTGVGEKETETTMRENHQLAISCMLPSGDQAHKLGICPDRELNHDPLVA